MTQIIAITNPINSISMYRMCRDYKVVDGQLSFTIVFDTKDQARAWLFSRANYLAESDGQLLDMYCDIWLREYLEYDHIKAFIIDKN